MLERLLDYIHDELPADATRAHAWQTLDITYEPPRVERLWRQLPDGNRVYLHRIHPCKQALFHPHPWPSAVMIVSGVYEMEVGYGAGDGDPPVAARMVLRAGTSYEMVDSNGWHSVRPVGGVSLSVMVTGAPWPVGVRHAPPPHCALSPLAPDAVESILAEIRSAVR